MLPGLREYALPSQHLGLTRNYLIYGAVSAAVLFGLSPFLPALNRHFVPDLAAFTLAPLLFAAFGQAAIAKELGAWSSPPSRLGLFAFWLLAACFAAFITARAVPYFWPPETVGWTGYPPMAVKSNTVELVGDLAGQGSYIALTLSGLGFILMFITAWRRGFRIADATLTLCLNLLMALFFVLYVMAWLSSVALPKPLSDEHQFMLVKIPVLANTYIILLPALAVGGAVISASSGRPVAWPALARAVASILGLGLILSWIYVLPRANIGTYQAISEFTRIVLPILAALTWGITIAQAERRSLLPVLWIGLGTVFMLYGVSIGMAAAAVSSGIALPAAYHLNSPLFYIHDQVLPALVAFCFVFGAWYAWFSDITGRYYRKPLAVLHFALALAGVGAALIPRHVPGLVAILRPEFGTGLPRWNSLASIGDYILIASFAVGVVTLIFSSRTKSP